jgi:hypothetical protein
LKTTTVQSGIGSSDDPAEIGESFFIYLVILEELCVVSKISEKPVEFPEGSFGAIQPRGKWPAFK